MAAKHSRPLYLSVALLALLLVVEPVLALPEAVPVYRYRIWTVASSPARLSFETQLIKLLLAQSEAKFGPYKLEFYTVGDSHVEALKHIRKGHFDFGLVTQWDKEPEHNEGLITLPYPVWNGYLGYRQLIVHSDSLNKFARVKSITDLRHFRVGQGEKWSDILYYRRNDIRVIESQSFSSLFAMLRRGRFEAIPLGVNEVDNALRKFNDQGDLAIVPNLILKYPLYIYFVVDERKPDLAARLATGFESILASGRYRTLLEEYMADKLEQIEDPNTIVLDL